MGTCARMCRGWAVPYDETLGASLLQHHVKRSFGWGEDVRRERGTEATTGAQIQLTDLRVREREFFLFLYKPFNKTYIIRYKNTSCWIFINYSNSHIKTNSPLITEHRPSLQHHSIFEKVLQSVILKNWFNFLSSFRFGSSSVNSKALLLLGLQWNESVNTCISVLTYTWYQVFVSNNNNNNNKT